MEEAESEGGKMLDARLERCQKLAGRDVRSPLATANFEEERRL